MSRQHLPHTRHYEVENMGESSAQRSAQLKDTRPVATLDRKMELRVACHESITMWKSPHMMAKSCAVRRPMSANQLSQHQLCTVREYQTR